jgi:DNA-binding SARP family transcriptional activator
MIFAIAASKAELHLGLGDHSRALSNIKTMVEIGSRHRILNDSPFWQGRLLSRLCAIALEHGYERDYVRDLIRARMLSPESNLAADWPWPVKVYTFGAFRLEVHGRAVAFSRKRPKKVLALLKALIAFGGQSVPERVLMDALWPDSEGDAGYDVLKITEIRLQRLLKEADVLEMRDATLGLNPAKCWVDALAFGALASGTDVNALEAEKALALYQGTFLMEDIEQPWSIAARERWRSKFVRLVAHTGKSLEMQSMFEEAMQIYQRGIEADDLCEDFYQGMMRCYLAVDRPAAGIAIFRRLRQLLSISLGIVPSQESHELLKLLQARAS